MTRGTAIAINYLVGELVILSRKYRNTGILKEEIDDEMNKVRIKIADLLIKNIDEKKEVVKEYDRPNS